MKYIKQMFCIALMLLLTIPITAGENNSKDKPKIDVQGIVFGHIKDSYEWHVTDIGDTHIIFYLPVIVKSSTGWHVFLSNRFEESADGKVDGLYISKSKEYENKIVENINGREVRPLDLSFTKTAAALVIDSIILLLCILIPAHWYKKRKPSDAAPRGFTGFMEMFVMYITDEIIKPSVGKGYEKYVPYLLTCFFFVFTCNLMGVVPFPPGGGNVTGNIAITFFLAMCTFVIVQFSGTKHYWKDIFWPEVPLWLKFPIPMMPVIEFVGIFTKPFALMVRLFANMMAGHAIILSLTCIIFIMASVGVAACTSMTIVSIALSVFMDLLEILVCLIQALVFTMLSAVFISLARIKPAEA